MAVDTVTITGKVLRPDGQPATVGSITCELIAPGSALDGSTWQRIGGSTEATIGVDGSVSFGLVPNDTLVPAGTAYRCSFQQRTTGHAPIHWVELWQLATTPDPIDVGAIVRLDAIPGYGLYAPMLIPGIGIEGSESIITATGSTTARKLKDRFADVVNVKDFGAKGDGVTDDTAAINAAFTAASANQDVVFPRGTYIVSDTLSVNGSNKVLGEGSQSTYLQWATGASSTGKAILRLRGRTVHLRGLNLQGNASNAPDTGIDFYPDLALIAQQHVLDDVWVGINTPPAVGLWSHDPPSGQQHEMIAIRNSRITGRDVGILFDKIHEDLWSISNCYIGHTSATGSSIRMTGTAKGMGLGLYHVWLIGPHFGLELASGSEMADIMWEASGAEGPTTAIEMAGSNSLRLTVRGEGIGGPVHVGTNQGLQLKSSDSYWFATTAGAKNFTIDANANVFWQSTGDRLYLDGVPTSDLDAFSAQAKTGSGVLVFKGQQYGDNLNVVGGPLRVGGARTTYFYNDKPMLEVQPLYSTSANPALRVKKANGNVEFEVSQSLGSTGQEGIILGGVRMFWLAAAPGAGTWAVGDIVWNTAPAAGGAPGWVCTGAGTPGTWKAMANVAS